LFRFPGGRYCLFVFVCLSRCACGECACDECACAWAWAHACDGLPGLVAQQRRLAGEEYVSKRVLLGCACVCLLG
jgi:hypothetical protein